MSWFRRKPKCHHKWKTLRVRYWQTNTISGPLLLTGATQICEKCNKARFAQYEGEWTVKELNE